MTRHIILIRILLWAAMAAGTAAYAGDLPVVADLGLASGYQNTWFGHLKRGRANVAADFDLDGRVDFYLGSPADESIAIRNVTPAGGAVAFELAQVLLNGVVAVGGSAADYDNDGDYDLFVTSGGIEGSGYCYLFKNLWIENGVLEFADVTTEAGVAGSTAAGGTEPLARPHTNGVWGDIDQDGDVDLFVSVIGRNILWRNLGNGEFRDETAAAGLGGTTASTFHSTFFDFDNDGDLDLFENNFTGLNVLWRNEWVESGHLHFSDVTISSSAPGDDLRYPYSTFASACADFNNDGWQDLMVFRRLPLDLFPDPFYPNGHVIFINQPGIGFANVAEAVGLNSPYFDGFGVMGCQLGDLNGDGIPDVFLGHGSPAAGEENQLFVSDAELGPVGSLPRYANVSALINTPAPEGSEVAGYPAAPYRTHGANFVDVDNDGRNELAVAEGGMYSTPTPAPNRLFQFTWPAPFHYLKVRAIGDGIAVSRDAIGTRFALQVSAGAGPVRTLYNTVLAGSGFSAQQGFVCYFGLGDADTVHSLTLTWPDGAIETHSSGIAVDTLAVFQRAGELCESVGPARFRRGDCNRDATRDLGDAVTLLSALFEESAAAVTCPDACDANDDGRLDVCDAIYYLTAIFLSGTALPPPFLCGPDPTGDALGCM